MSETVRGIFDSRQVVESLQRLRWYILQTQRTGFEDSDQGPLLWTNFIQATLKKKMGNKMDVWIHNLLYTQIKEEEEGYVSKKVWIIYVEGIWVYGINIWEI